MSSMICDAWSGGGVSKTTLQLTVLEEGIE